MKQSQQATLAAPVSLSGIGVHSGKPVNLHLHPAQANHGIVFLRTGLPGGEDRLIDARGLEVTATELCTVIGNGAVSTIEHLMSACMGLSLDNVLVEIDGPEVPIMDGSAAAFVDAIDQAGLTDRALPPSMADGNLMDNRILAVALDIMEREPKVDLDALRRATLGEA